MVATYCILFLGSIALCALLTRTIRDIALSHDWASVRLKHHVHSGEIPRVGGIAIFASVSVIVGIAATYYIFTASVFTLPLLQILGAVIGASVIFLLGLYDDFRGANAYAKLAIQILAASIVFACNLQIRHLPLLGNHTFGVIASWVGTVFWILLITNGFNLVDGLDGLAAGSALFSTLTVFGVCLYCGRLFTALVALALAGSILGFLRYNFNPATVFLGDCGSLLIGFILSVLALLETEKTPTLLAVAIPIVSFGFPILDTVLAVVRRLIAGQPLFQADREHIHHKLLQRGFSQRGAVVLLYAVSAMFGLLSAFFYQPAGPVLGLTLFVLGIGVWMGIQHLRYPEFLELGRLVQRTVEQKQTIINNLALRRAVEELSRAAAESDVCKILREAFESTGFLAFEVRYLGSSHLEPASLHYHWQRSKDHTNNITQWHFTLDLTIEGSNTTGYLTVHKNYDKGSLQLDLNLLIRDLRIALSSALVRLMHETSQQGVIEEGRLLSGSKSLTANA